VDYDRETLQKPYREKVGKYEALIAELKKVGPEQKVGLAAIVVGATGVFHVGRALTRWKRNAVDMVVQGSYQVFIESMERDKHIREHPPHEVDLMPAEDEDPIGLELASYKEITGIESYPASVLVREVAVEENRLPPLWRNTQTATRIQNN
jgi:hypothetical protein